jgi:Flp pilus assembly protein TadG
MTQHKRLRSLARDEEGFSLVFVALGFMGFLAAGMLAIDVGMLMTSRNQAQNSADASALAGATALVYDDWDNRTPTGPAVTNALVAAAKNKVMGGAVAIAPADVVFLDDPAGNHDRVKATVYRDAAHGNPVSTLIAQYFGMKTANILATATAEASPANAMTCVKPFTIPDRWLENGRTPSMPTDTYSPSTDVYIGPDDPVNYTGYNAERDKGLEITLKADNGTNIAPSFYYPYDIPGSVGASDYRTNIGSCNTTIMQFGQTFNPEPGNMVGPTKQGTDDLVARDPDAYWDTVNNRVVSSMNPSPRVVAIPLFDPNYYYTGKMNGRNASLKFINYLGFFIEPMQGNQVVGRITPIGGLRQGNGGPAPAGAFPRVIRLVQ